MAEFRISINLSNFYQDYRSYSRVFVSSNIKTIHDLHDHVEDLFKLNCSFYLMSNNFYLPYDEDVRILKEDDTICLFANNLFERKRKKGTRRCEKNSESETEVFEKPAFASSAKCDDSIPVKKVKKSKKGKVMETVLNEDTEEIKPSENIKAKCKDLKFIDKRIEFTKSKRKVELLPISIIPKIIKPIVYNCGIPVVTQDVKPMEKLPSISDNNAALNEDMDCEPVSNKEAEQKVENNHEHLLENCSDVSKDEINEVLVNGKKKRHRVRHRKKKVKEVFSDSVVEVSQPVFRKPVSGIRATHIKFKDDESEDDVEALDSSSKFDESSNKFDESSNKFDESLSKIHESSNKFDESLSKIHESSNKFLESSNKFHESLNITVPIIDKKENNFETESNFLNDITKEVSNFPLMGDITPKENDVIGFKIYMLSNSYTPEISGLIIGKVRSYSVEEKKVKFRLLEGSEQCYEPDGKFSMQDNPDEISTIREEFFWNELIEPRLLFP